MTASQNAPTKPPLPRRRRRTLFAILSLPLAVLLLLGLRVFVLEAFRIPSGGMLPTLEVGDHIYANKMVYRFHAPARGDVIVFRFPEDPRLDFIKRVVAIGGDTVEIRQNRVYLNEQPIPRQLVRTVQYEDILDDMIPPLVEVREADEVQETLGPDRYSIYLNP